MPTHRTCDWSLRATCALLPGVIAIALGCSSGCRLLRCPQTSDEAVAAARQLSLQGMDAQERGRWDQAETLYALAVERCPRDERARCGYAESLWQRGAQEDAIKNMEEAVRLSGHDPERMVQLGKMYLARGQLLAAAAQAEAAIAANRQMASAWALHGQVLQAQGSRTEALASFHRALSYQQQFPEVQLALAEIYKEQNRPQRALATLQALADALPPSQVPVEVLVQQGLALRELARHQDAALCLATAAARCEPSADLLYELGRTQLLAGDATAARLSVAAGLARDAQHPGCLALSSELAPPQGIVAAMLNSR